jgi:hypothetical protein
MDESNDSFLFVLDEDGTGVSCDMYTVLYAIWFYTSIFGVCVYKTRGNVSDCV